MTVSLTEAVKEAARLSYLFTWMGLSPLRTLLLVDNQPAIHIAQNPSLSQPDHAYPVGINYIRRRFRTVTSLEYVNTEEQLADIATKILGHV